MAANPLVPSAPRRRAEGGTLGLDEAGRGSALGPLVVGAFLLPAGRTAEDLRALGVRDSKLLRPATREELYGVLGAHGVRLAYRAEPALVDRYASQGRLNELELTMMSRLVARLAPSDVMVDACDPNADRFGRRLRDMAAHRGWEGKVDARHHADRDLPVVGAASIVAKVVRDRAMARLQASSVRLLGSGYPSDPVTRAYLKRLLSEGAVLPSCVRRSWSTLDTLKSGPRLRTLETYR